MATTLAFRHPAPLVFGDRPRSVASTTGSRNSSTFSDSASHHKFSSQTSLIPQTPQRPPPKSSRPSSITDRHMVPQRSKRLKSQYPLNSIERHVEYILVASFDIDRGPVMEHQFPDAVSPDEDMLAELMLPDQTHVRTQDWTMFFLHKDTVVDEEAAFEKEERRAVRRERMLGHAQKCQEETEETDDADSEADSSEDEDVDKQEGPPLMYVLNLVNTRQDSTAKRGAVVKAMAICTRHSFLHIYKPLLLLALEDYFKSPYPETLELLYNSLNAMDLSLMPRLSLAERNILQASDAKDMFVEKYEQMIQQRLIEEAQTGDLVEVPDSPTRSGQRYAVPRDTHDFESKIVYNGIHVPVKVPTALSPEMVGDFSLIKLVQIFGGPHGSQPQPFALHPHLTTSGAYTHPIIVLINAMLTQKRVIFLGHNRPSGEVAEAVLAACALASGGILRGFTRHAFPYTDLTKIDDLLKVPGFVAGVTNPAFSYHPEWWDLLCDLPSGRMKISSSIEPASVTEGSTFFQHHGHTVLANFQKDNGHIDPTGDSAFMDDINRSIASRHGEALVRAKFRGYVTKFTRIAAAFEEIVYGASPLTVISPTEIEDGDTPLTPQTRLKTAAAKGNSQDQLKGHGYVWPSDELKTRELAASASRLEGWRHTRSYDSFISDLASRTKNAASPTSPTSMTNIALDSPARTHFDIYHALSRLRTLRLLPSEAAAIYLALDSHCIDYESILELLELSPTSEAGLFYLSFGLWHEDRKVREAVAALLDRVRNHAAGRLFFARLGAFVHMGWMRVWQEREARTGGPNEEEEEDLSAAREGTNGFGRGC